MSQGDLFSPPSKRELLEALTGDELRGIAERNGVTVEPEAPRESMGDAGCPACRMDLIRFTREVKLPRFTMREGEEWDLRQKHYTAEGAELGCGVAPRSSFEIVVVNVTQCCGCPCRRPEVEP